MTATLGEHGTNDPVAWPPARLAARRRRELRASLAALGVSEHLVLGFEDGDCASCDGTDAIADLIAGVGPDVVVTFGPDGMTGHPDHRAVSRWTTAAWRTTGREGELWYATVTPDFHRRWGPVNEQIGLWSEQPEPPCTSVDELCHVITLPRHHLDAKLTALRAHRSQTAALEALIGAASFRRWWATEAFRAAAGVAALGGERHATR